MPVKVNLNNTMNSFSNNPQPVNSNDLTNQIKKTIGVIKNKVKENEENETDDLNEFILRNSKELVESGIEAINEIKQTVLLNPQSDEVEALAEIFKGVSSAMSILKDIHIAKMKTENSKEIKQMDIESKRQLEKIEDSKSGVQMTRDEIFKMLMQNEDIVDTEFTLLSS
jgi:Mg2+ and Co2+ transporter CorA